MKTTWLVLVVLFVSFSQAFKPNSEGHGGITNEALERLGFCRDARDAIESGNLLTDILEQLRNSAHFDGESLEEASKRLIVKADETVELIDAAVDQLDDDDFFGDIEDFFDGVLEFFADSVSIISPTVASLLGTTSEQRSAWAATGQALHSLQDFYSHSNWVEMGNSEPFSDLGREELDPPPANSRPCPNDPAVLDLDGDGGNILTTGYFDFDPTKHCELESEPGKCRHGWDLAGCASGLNKDEPSRPNYSQARAIAVEATVAYVRLILDRLEDMSERHVEMYKGNCNPTNETQVFYAEGELGSSCKTFNIDVDETGEDYELRIELEDIDSVTLVDPLGSEFDDDDMDVNSDDAQVDLGDNPVSGTYQLELCGSSGDNYKIELVTESTIISFNAYFTRTTGGRNAGQYPITSNQQPILGQANNLYADFYGSTIASDTIEFHFVSSESGTVLKSFTLSVDESDTDGLSFSGDVVIDFEEPFFLRADGELKNGDTFVRYFRSKVYQAQYPDVQLFSEEDSFQFGPDSESVSFQFSVTNHDSRTVEYTFALRELNGFEDSFSGSINAITSSKSKTLDTSSVTLSSGETVVVEAVLTIDDHDDMDVGDVIQMNFRARASGSNHENSVDVVGQYVGCGGNPVCNGNGVCDVVTNECSCIVGLSCDDDDSDDEDDDDISLSLPSFGSPSDGSDIDDDDISLSLPSFGSPSDGSDSSANTLACSFIALILLFII